MRGGWIRVGYFQYRAIRIDVGSRADHETPIARSAPDMTITVRVASILSMSYPVSAQPPGFVPLH
jgi:hypothetical protein